MLIYLGVVNTIADEPPNRIQNSGVYPTINKHWGWFVPILHRVIQEMVGIYTKHVCLTQFKSDIFVFVV